MIYGSICSGIEAASAAWHPLGWRAAFLSEIEPFPRAVLRHHYPDVPLHGDFTTIREGDYAAIDLLVGGTPCQSFSVAGLRKGLDDDRGNLALEYLRLADRLRPRWLVWENVPGVLSSNGGRDFGSILGGMVELGYGFAYRVLDAQYVRVDGFGRAVPQRRRRVFVVGCLGDWRRAAAVLFDRESLSGNPPPRREAGQGVAPTISARPTGGGGLGTDFDCDGGLIASTGSVAHCLNAGGMGRIDYETETMVAHALRGEGFDASEDGTGRGTPLVPVAFNHQSGGDFRPQPSWDLANALQRSQGQAVAFSAKDYGGDAMEGVSPTLRAGGHAGSHANAGVMPAVAFDLRGREGGAMPEGPHDTANIRAASGGSSRSYVDDQWAVRRLTPRECERLQGFPDDWTAIDRLGGKPAADSPRYKAIGNSMAVNVMRWIGRRIEMADSIETAA